ncbi:MAG: hypothetical protein MK085_07130 [Phycisphaerales bacterium]|nr:hypothetical protein [Phycisphaerales bacterium]
MSDHKTFPHPDRLDDPEFGATWFLTLASVVVFIVCVLALSAVYFDFEEAEVETKIMDQPVIALQKLRLGQEELLTTYGRYSIEDPDGNIIERIRIPITQAMEREVADARAQAVATGDEEAVAAR